MKFTVLDVNRVWISFVNLDDDDDDDDDECTLLGIVLPRNPAAKRGEKKEQKKRSDIFGIHYTTQQTVHFCGIWRCNLHVYVT